MPNKVFVNIGAKKIRVGSASATATSGETLLGEIDHHDAGTNDTQGYKGSHVLYQHIEKLMIKAELYDYHLYSISVDAPEPETPDPG